MIKSIAKWPIQKLNYALYSIDVRAYNLTY